MHLKFLFAKWSILSQPQCDKMSLLCREINCCNKIFYQSQTIMGICPSKGEIQGLMMQLHFRVFCGMQLIIHARENYLHRAVHLLVVKHILPWFLQHNIKSAEIMNFFLHYMWKNRIAIRYEMILSITETSNGRSIECLYMSLFRQAKNKHQRSVLLSLCEGNPLVTTQRDSSTENISIWWRHNARRVFLDQIW